MKDDDKRRAEDREDEYEDRPRYGRNSRKRHTGLKVFLILLLILVVGGATAGVFGERYYRSHFVRGTVVNGIDVSGKTVDEVEKQLGTALQDYKLTIHERTGDGGSTDETISGGEIGLEMTFDDSLQKLLLSQQNGNWARMLANGAANNTKITTGNAYNQEAFRMKMDALQCFQDDFIQQPENAYLADDYEIVAEVVGNAPNRDPIVNAISAAVLSLQTELDLNTVDGAYQAPAITSDNKELQAKYNVAKKYLNMKITYTFGDNQEVLDGKTIMNWITIGDDNSVTVDTSKVDDFVVSLRKKYDTIFRKRTFMTTYGKEITITDGDYGWWMNYKKEEKDLAEAIENGEDGERTPAYYQTAAQYGTEDWGNTYVEINLTAQHLFFYKNGKLLLESDLVSGNSSKGNGTPEGIYGVTYKERNATLEGENYATPVSWWMPFNKNVGMHDAIWRDQFGSNFYQSSGSHGCINLPYRVAKKIYKNIEKGTAVICYNMKGTESDSVTRQSAKEIAQATTDAINAIGEVEKTKNCKELIERARQLYDDLSSEQRKYIKNYDTLKAAEKKYKELAG